MKRWSFVTLPRPDVCGWSKYCVAINHAGTVTKSAFPAVSAPNMLDMYFHCRIQVANVSDFERSSTRTQKKVKGPACMTYLAIHLRDYGAASRNSVPRLLGDLHIQNFRAQRHHVIYHVRHEIGGNVPL